MLSHWQLLVSTERQCCSPNVIQNKKRVSLGKEIEHHTLPLPRMSNTRRLDKPVWHERLDVYNNVAFQDIGHPFLKNHLLLGKALFCNSWEHSACMMLQGSFMGASYGFQLGFSSVKPYVKKVLCLHHRFNHTALYPPQFWPQNGLRT